VSPSVCVGKAGVPGAGLGPKSTTVTPGVAAPSGSDTAVSTGATPKISSPTVDCTAHQIGSRADAQATDALAAEALDATDGAFTTVADAIEAGPDSVSPGYSTGSKPGFQTASKALLSMHIQAPGTTKPSTVTPNGIDSNAPSTVDPTANRAGAATSGGRPRTPPIPTLGVPGASAITRIGTGSSDALGNTDTRANTSNKSDIESTSVSSKSLPTENYDATLHGPEDPHTSDQPIYSINDELSCEALRHAFNVGTIEGKVPYGMDKYDPKIHGDDMDVYRSAQALGYRYQDYPEPTTPKHFMDALKVGYISARHKANSSNGWASHVSQGHLCRFSP